MKKTTLATIKSFIRRNLADLHIMTTSRFDGMTDCVEQTENPQIRTADVSKFNPADSSQMGIPGVWFVGGSRDYFNAVTTHGFIGYEVSNCCGTWMILIPGSAPGAPTELVRMTS